MWIFSKDGFFSAVKDSYCGDDELMVRARCKQDLERLAGQLESKRRFKILKTKAADYRYRMKTPKSLWVYYCARVAVGIDYSNVKSTIARFGTRHDAYMNVWHDLYDWQSELESREASNG